MNSSDTRRFGGIERLWGTKGFEAIRNAHVCIVGLGGVGSWCAESLARSAIGYLTLIDGDTVIESNINRQLAALGSTVGKPKALVLAERFTDINPQAKITCIPQFVSEDAPGALIPEDAVIIDAIDQLSVKTALIAWAKANGQTIFVSGGAGGRTDPSKIEAADLALVKNDALLAKVRSKLRKEHSFAAGSADPKKTRKFGIRAVFSKEAARGCSEDSRQEASAGFGTSMPVTAACGLRLAAEALQFIVGHSSGC